MAAKFYARYVPPPKVSGIDVTTGKKPEVTSTDHGVSKGHMKSPKSVKRPVPADEVDSRPSKRASVEPESSANVEADGEGLRPFTQPAQITNETKVSISSALPEWIRNPAIASSSAQKSFQEFPLSKKVSSNLSTGGFSTANGLQCSVLPMLLPRHCGPERYRGDVCISAATGSGKTLGYALPLIESLREKPVTRLRGLVVVPTRELVLQARKTLEIVATGTGVKIGVAVGNNHLKVEQESLVQKYQRWSPEASKHRFHDDERIKTDDGLLNWDLDYAEDNDHMECKPDHVLDYASNVDILVCTPGRLVEHLNCTKGFHLHHIEWLVIDEADRLLDESFQEWIAHVIPQLEYVAPIPPLMQQISQSFGLTQARRVQKIILSATMTKNLSKLNSLRLNRPRLVVLETLTESHAEQSYKEESIKLPNSLVEVAMAVTEANYKPLYVIQLLQEFAQLKREEAVVTGGINDSEDSSSDTSSLSSSDSSIAPQQKQARIPGTLIFAKSNESALRLARLLSMLLPDDQIRSLTKSSEDKKGRKTLSMFQQCKVSIVVATDLAARGLDIPQLRFVINYDMPASLISYVHRVGRTARAGREGRAVTLVEHKEGNWFWNEIARTKGLDRARKVSRMDGGLRAGQEEREKYEEALKNLGQEAVRKADGR